MSVNILMPALSPTMEEGPLNGLLRGDKIQTDLIAEIETDKATMEFEAVDEGIIGKLLVSEGSEGVKVNSPIAIILDDGEKLSETADLVMDKEHTKLEIAKEEVMENKKLLMIKIPISVSSLQLARRFS